MNGFRLIPGGDSPDDEEGEWEDDLDPGSAEFQGRAATAGREFKHTVEDFLTGLGAQIDTRGRRVGAYRLDFEVTGANGARLGILAHGTFDDDVRAGLRRTDTVKKMGFDAHQLGKLLPSVRLVAVISHLPNSSTAAATQLADAGDDLFDVVALKGDLPGINRLSRYLRDSPFPGQLDGPWRTCRSTFEPNLFDTADDPEER